MQASISQYRENQPLPTERSITASILGALVAVCAAVPYAVVGFLLRLVIARVFFLAGQAKITGWMIPIKLDISNLPAVDFTIVMPTALKPETLDMFATQYAGLPLPTTVAAYLFSYAEFVLPICLVIGFAARFAALALLAMTVLMTVYVMPEAFWPTHVYWIAILMVLVSVGPGAISIDALIGRVYRDSDPIADIP